MGKILMVLLKNLTVGLAADKNKRSKFLTLLGSIIVGTVLLLFAPLAVFISMGKTESPPVDVQFDEAAFLSQLSPEQQKDIAAVEADGQAIADAMAARGLQEQTIKAQLIYMSYFGENRLSDFAYYADLFYQSNEQLIQSLNDIYGIGINYDEFMRTYIFVMNSTINEYMFTDSGSKNAADLAAWCRNACESCWSYADYCIGERTGENRLRCADNIGLIMGYIRYDINNKVFTSDIVDMYYTEQGSIDTMPDVQGVGVSNGDDFGVYVGGGQVVFSSAIGGCVQQQALEYGNWTSWCTFDAISYPQEVWDRVNELHSEEENEGE
ncbi:hypothetical protein [Ruminococcus sp.]|uniref:hypothetical protein n=1 Tax=Ruminococcus sp. TaxID=41978 RepID=UPI001B648FF5|nr:hypothetical protein [Ruminococcus sp.]MBP5431966.1 hypothetical protein [Ruminococcus sp.]